MYNQRIGSIRFKMASGLEKMIKEVRYVPYLKRSLLSLGMFDKQGYMIKVDNRTLRKSWVSEYNKRSSHKWSIHFAREISARYCRCSTYRSNTFMAQQT